MTRPNLPVAATAREVIRASADLRGEGPTDGELLRRYAEARDEAAFAALVHRHAGLVLGVCRRLLGDAHDAEDACQATFLVLARKAGSVNWQPSVANWLYRTARQIAANARVAARRRARREGRSAVPEQVPAVDAMPVREVLEVFEEELARLPARYRGPLILCCLEGLARDEAARQLGVPPATLKGQLGRARERLRVALARRGITLGAALVAAAATSPAGAGSPRLVRAVLAAAGGEAPPAVAALAAGAAGGSVSKVGVVLVMLSVGMLGGALASGRSAATDPPAPDSAEKPVAAAPADAGPRADRYGDPLPPGALMRLGTVRFRHGGQLHAIAYSADGKTIASGGFGTGRIMLWEAATGKPIATLEREQPAGQGYVFDLAFSPDGKWLVSVGSRTTDHESVGEVVFWDLSTRTCGEVIPTIAGTRNRWARAVAISPDGKTVAAGTDSGTLLLLDAKTRRVRELIEKVDTSIAGLAFSRDGKSLAVGGYRGAFLFDPTTGRETGRLETGEITRAVAFAPDGKSLWVGKGVPVPRVVQGRGGPATLTRWDLETGRAEQTFELSPGMFAALGVSPDGKWLAVGILRGGAYLCDTATGEKHELDSGRNAILPWVQGVAFAPDGKRLAVADSLGRVRVWDVGERKELHLYDEHQSGVARAVLSPDEKQIATCSVDGTVRLWDPSAGRTVRSWQADEELTVFGVHYTPDGKSLLTYGWDDTVRLWDAASGREIRRFPARASSPRAALSPDGKVVAASGEEGRAITLYDTQTARPLRECVGHGTPITDLTFSADGRYLVSASGVGRGADPAEDLTVRVWDVATGEQLRKLEAGRSREIVISPDGRVVAASVYPDDEKAAFVRFWDTVSGREMTDRRLPGTQAIAFSADGRYFATGDRDIHVREVASGQVVRTLPGSTGSTRSLMFSRDGQRLVSAHDDGTALVWDLSPGRPDVEDPARLWEALASDRAEVAWRAAGALTARPDEAVAVLKERLRPVPKPEPPARSTASLITDLGADRFDVREAATEELIRRAGWEFEALQTAKREAKSPEVRERLERVLRQVPPAWGDLDGPALREVRAVAVLEAIGTEEARRVLSALAEGDPAARRTREAGQALARLQRKDGKAKPSDE